jgi:hypothetical protein
MPWGAVCANQVVTCLAREFLRKTEGLEARVMRFLSGEIPIFIFIKN